MNNSEKYSFSDFTHEHYDRLLKSATSKYKFSNYNDLKNQTEVIIWRHDVDFSIHEALRLAKIEAQNGVRATYFLLPHSDFYSLLEKSTFGKVKEIQSLGHEIALHFDPSFFEIEDEKGLRTALLFEKKWLEKLFGQKIKVFSFHNPNAFVLECFVRLKYAGLLNTYSTFFKTKFGYCSDSNGYWRHDRLIEVIESEKHKNLQILTHPEWWTKTVQSPKQKVWRCLDGRAAAAKKAYLELLEMNGRKTIDWE